MAAIAARPPRRRNPIVAEDRRAGWIFVMPAMLIFLVFIFGAVLFAFYVRNIRYKDSKKQKPVDKQKKCIN